MILTFLKITPVKSLKQHLFAFNQKVVFRPSSHQLNSDCAEISFDQRISSQYNNTNKILQTSLKITHFDLLIYHFTPYYLQSKLRRRAANTKKLKILSDVLTC